MCQVRTLWQLIVPSFVQCWCLIWQEVAKQEIRPDHISKDIVQIILDYMYCEDVSFHKDHLMALIEAADYFQMAELKEMFLDEVPDILEPGNIISWWKEAAKMSYDNMTEPCERDNGGKLQTYFTSDWLS